jgi:hypothetical protein
MLCVHVCRDNYLHGDVTLFSFVEFVMVRLLSGVLCVYAMYVCACEFRMCL